MMYCACRALTVMNFSVFMKEQKNLQQQLTRYSDASSKKVKKDVQNLQQKVAMVSTTFQREAQNVTSLKEDMQKVNITLLQVCTCARVHALKYEILQELKNGEISQRTQEVPAGLQHENTVPDRFIVR